MILRGSVYSEVLEMDTGLTIITPSDFPEPGTPKVAYLLHGLGAANGSWSECSLLPLYAREHNVVFIMPEAGRSYYTDMAYGQRFFTYIADELPALAAKTFRFSDKREDTAVLGGSMGGYGALKCALSRPDRFGLCCAFAPGNLHLRERIEKMKAFGDMDALRHALGWQRTQDYRATYGDDFTVKADDDISELVVGAAEAVHNTRFYQACGSEDPFHKSNIRFRDDVRRLGLDHTYEEWPGGHDWDFFNEALLRGLRFCFGVGLKRPIEVSTIE
ncbi:MAG: esterase family protein [Planctomycetes bacterium]|nr:esterase family protein [Planctomycetota bacterium]